MQEREIGKPAMAANGKALIALSGLAAWLFWGTLPPLNQTAVAQDGGSEHTLSTSLYGDAVLAIENNEIVEGVEKLRQAAEAGEIRALVLYRVLVDILSDTPQSEPSRDVQAALDEITSLTDRELGRRAYDIALTYLEDDDRLVDADEAISLFEAAANSGYPSALIQLGVAYRNGVGVEADGASAVGYFEEAASAGLPSALIQLGITYRDGRGVEADAARAIGYFEEAAEAGYASALVHLGSIYQDGRGVEADATRALSYFEQAADAGVPAALVQLGVAYRNGVGVEADGARAVSYFEEAAAAGLPSALIQLGITYRDGRGVEADAARAIGYFEEAAEAGYASALVQLGNIYQDGRGVEADAARAFGYFEEAADAGVPAALVEVGIAYRDGLGVAVDAERALSHLQQAAQAGIPAALVELGIAHREGLGMAADVDRAFEYFEEAASQGIPSGASEALLTWISRAETDGGVPLLTRFLDADFDDDGRWLVRVYRPLNANERVKLIQLLLNATGRPVAVDGLFGTETIVAVQEICLDLDAAGCRGPLLTIDTIRLLHQAYATGV